MTPLGLPRQPSLGLVFKDYLGVTSAVGSSARYASLGSSYRWVAASGSTPGAFVQSGGTWVPCSPVSGVAPRVGVSIKVRHSSITAFIPANVVVSATGVFAFEPGSVPSC